MTACPICQLRRENEQMAEQQAAVRKALGKCWINGGMVNNTDETTVITIDAKIGPKAKASILELLKQIES